MTIREMAQANKAAGNHWFEPDTMRFFASRVSSETYECADGRWLFVSSECPPRGVRRYTVRSFDPKTAGVDTVGEFQAYATLSQAKRAARALADAVPA